MKYNKLVRDNIPKIIESKGETCLFHVANAEEYWQKLKEKLREEIEEFIEAENIEELADVFEVINAMQTVKKFDSEELLRVMKQKADMRGRFFDRIILEES